MIFAQAQSDSFSGTLRDLSPSGFCAQVPSDTAASLTATLAGGTTIVHPCRIEFETGVSLSMVVEICHVFPAAGRSTARVGACFIDLDARSERALERQVARLERARARLR